MLTKKKKNHIIFCVGNVSLLEGERLVGLRTFEGESSVVSLL